MPVASVTLFGSFWLDYHSAAMWIRTVILSPVDISSRHSVTVRRTLACTRLCHPSQTLYLYFGKSFLPIAIDNDVRIHTRMSTCSWVCMFTCMCAHISACFQVCSLHAEKMLYLKCVLPLAPTERCTACSLHECALQTCVCVCVCVVRLCVCVCVCMTVQRCKCSTLKPAM